MSLSDSHEILSLQQEIDDILFNEWLVSVDPDANLQRLRYKYHDFWALYSILTYSCDDQPFHLLNISREEYLKMLPEKSKVVIRHADIKNDAMRGYRVTILRATKILPTFPYYNTDERIANTLNGNYFLSCERHTYAVNTQTNEETYTRTDLLDKVSRDTYLYIKLVNDLLDVIHKEQGFDKSIYD